jgi:uncharacterized membrane protein YkoI
MKKKILVILISLVLAALTLLSGCSLGGSNNDTSDSTTSEHHSEESHHDESSSSRISRQEAVSIVLDRVEGAEEDDIKELDTDHDDGQFVYEGELVYDGYEYDFEIDGETGEIISWEIDRD